MSDPGDNGKLQEVPDWQYQLDYYTKFANEHLETLIRARLPGQVIQVYLAILREIFGYNEKYRRVTLTTLSRMTDIPHKKVGPLVKRLIRLRMIERLPGKVKNGFVLRLVNNPNTWKVTLRKPIKYPPRRGQVIPPQGDKVIPLQGDPSKKSETLKKASDEKTDSEKTPQTLEAEALIDRLAGGM